MGAVKPVVTPKTQSSKPKVIGVKVNGKQFMHGNRNAFRPTAGQRTYQARMALELESKLAKTLETEMKEEKAAKRQLLVENIKNKREKKAERERFELLSAKLNQKRIDRLKRKEKRNKMIKS